MTAVLRLGLVIAAGGLCLAGAPVLAQSAAVATTNTPATDSIGPRELQNFNLQGAVTRPAERAPTGNGGPANPAPAPRAPPTAAIGGVDHAAPSRTSAGASVNREPGRAPGRRVVAARALAPSRAQPPAPDVANTGADLRPAVPAPAFSAAADVAPMSLAPERDLPVWPWFLAAFALGAGGAFLFWRRNARGSYARAPASAPGVDVFVAHEPVPAPPPAAAPRTAAPKPAGVISTSLRPWIEVSFTPLRCIVEDQGVTFEFDVELFNSGGAPARDVLVEANIFNASAAQDQELGRFFGNPAANGDSIPTLPPLQRVGIRPQVTVPLDQVRILEAGGRRVFVPLIAFNAIYRWGQGAGQTSAAYLLGRETKSDKLAPFRLDLGPRVFRGLGARALPIAVRT